MVNFINKAKKYLSPENIRELTALDTRLAGMQTIRIVSMGLVNAGKSSLLNALIDDVSGETFAVGAARKTVTEQEVHLTDNIYLVDTPGIDAVDSDDVTALESVISSDIMIMVHNIRLGEMHEVECKWLERITAKLGSNVSDRLIFVLSWIDGRDGDEDYNESVNKTQDMVRTITGANINFINVSAHRYTKGQTSGNTRLADKSNINELKALMLEMADSYRQKKKAVFHSDVVNTCSDIQSVLNGRVKDIITIRDKKKASIADKYERILRQYNDYFKTLQGKLSRLRRLLKECAELKLALPLMLTGAGLFGHIGSFFGK